MFGYRTIKIVSAMLLMLVSGCATELPTPVTEPTAFDPAPIPTVVPVEPSTPTPKPAETIIVAAPPAPTSAREPYPTVAFANVVASSVAQIDRDGRFEVLEELTVEDIAVEDVIQRRSPYPREDRADWVSANGSTFSAMAEGWNRGHLDEVESRVEHFSLADRWADAAADEGFDLKLIRGSLRNNGPSVPVTLGIALFDSTGDHILTFTDRLIPEETTALHIIIPVLPELWPDIASVKLLSIDDA